MSTCLYRNQVFSYSFFNRVAFRNYLPNLFVAGIVINLLRNLEFKDHSNGVFKLLTEQLTSNINKQATNISKHNKVNFICDFKKVEAKHSIRKI